MSCKIIILFVVACVHLSLANPVDKKNFIQQENSCRSVCELCDCDGFYCEDECICECNVQSEDSKFHFLIQLKIVESQMQILI